MNGYEDELPERKGRLPLGLLLRTEPAGTCPAPVAVVRASPVPTRYGVVNVGERRVRLPLCGERRSFEDETAKRRLRAFVLDPLGLRAEDAFLVDLHPFVVGDARRDDERKMLVNVALYERMTGVPTGIEGWGRLDLFVERCKRPGNLARLREWFEPCAPALVVTLGAAPAAFARDAHEREVGGLLHQPPRPTSAFGTETLVIHLPDLHELSRGAKCAWMARHRSWCATTGRHAVEQALRSWRPPPAGPRLVGS